MRNFNLPSLGAGAGLRHAHFQSIINDRPAFRWFEIIVEDFLGFGGAIRESLQEIRKNYPIIGHGVCLAIGSTDPLNIKFLKKLRAFLDEFKIPWTSDHLCFTMVDHTNLNDLIPLPFTQEAVDNIVERLKIVQHELARPFMLENVTRYITVSDREMSESEFINQITDRANCGLLLDVTNVYLNSKFHNYDPVEFVKTLPLHRVGQMHIAGWDPLPDGSIIDSHDAPVPPEVWSFFEKVISLTGPSSALIEWDAQIPTASRLLEETLIAQNLMDKIWANSLTYSKQGINQVPANF